MRAVAYIGQKCLTKLIERSLKTEQKSIPVFFMILPEFSVVEGIMLRQI